MKKVIAASLTLLFLFSFLYPKASFALSCAELPAVEDAYERYDGVIIGQVEEVKRNDNSNVVKLNVLQSFKGIEDDHLSVEENITWGSLWGPSIKEEKYLFFLKKNDTEWENPLCSPTKLLSDASEELDFLQDKEIQLKSEPAQTEHVLKDNPTNKQLPVKVASSNQPLTTTSPINWMIILGIIGLIGVIVIVLARYRRHIRKY
ncbi:MAG: hypothetical protein ACE3L7_31115 [Candidatus Pristimantibacillus sp.]